jgi:hypothetical protein
MDAEFAEILPTGSRSSVLVEDSFAIEKFTILSDISIYHLGDNSISPVYFPDTPVVVILVLVKLTGVATEDG